MQRLADHAVSVVPKGLNVVVVVGEETAIGHTMHAAISSRTSEVDVSQLLRHFADIYDERLKPRIGRREQGSLEHFRAALDQAVRDGVDSITVRPDMLLRFIQESTMS